MIQCYYRRKDKLTTQSFLKCSLKSLTYFKGNLHALLSLFFGTAVGTMENKVRYILITVSERENMRGCYTAISYYILLYHTTYCYTILHTAIPYYILLYHTTYCYIILHTAIPYYILHTTIPYMSTSLPSH